jgi:hypothetical protein
MGHGFVPFAQCLGGCPQQLEPVLTAGSSWIIHLYTNECVQTNLTAQRDISQASFSLGPWIERHEQL